MCSIPYLIIWWNMVIVLIPLYVLWKILDHCLLIQLSKYFLQLSEQEDLIVWMRTAALPTFRKLYGKIEQDFDANQKISVVVQNNYNTYSFGGKKKLVLSTTSWIGGKNDFLGVGYLTIGGLSLALAVGFMLVYILKPRLVINGLWSFLFALISLSFYLGYLNTIHIQLY